MTKFDESLTATLEEYEVLLKIGCVITDIESGERLTKGTQYKPVEKRTAEMRFGCPPVLIGKVCRCD